jgi:hypothetical protein
MNVYGYILPPYPINGFVLPILQNEKEQLFYFDNEQKKTFRIRKADALKRIKEITEKKAYKGGELYCYLRETGAAKIGSFEELFEYLINLLFSKKINHYAKLIVASFLQYPGRISKIIVELNSENKQRNLNFTMLPIEPTSYHLINLDKKDEVTDIVDTYLDMLEVVPQLSWEDLIFIEDDFVFFKNCKITISDFTDLIVDSNDIFKEYFQNKDMTEISTIFKRNKLFAGDIFNDKIPTPIPYNELNKEKFSFNVTYFLDRHAVQIASKKNTKKGIDKNELKKQLQASSKLYRLQI